MASAPTPSFKILIALFICLALAALMLVAGSAGGASVGGIPLFVIAGVLPFLLHWAVFLPSFMLQTEHYFDLTGALSFIGAILLAYNLGQSLGLPLDTRSLLLAAMVLTWSLRLGSFLFLRVKKAGEDRRFREIKTRFLRFMLTWTLGGLWVLFTIAPSLAALTSGRSVPLDALSFVALALWFVGLMLEVIADRQKSTFRANPENKDAFIHTGVWSLSRHPNYLGEMMLWCGAALLAAPALQGWQLMTLISPLFVILLLCRVSGIPLLEARAEEKWGNDPAYREYVRRTPVLIPGFHEKKRP